MNKSIRITVMNSQKEIDHVHLLSAHTRKWFNKDETMNKQMSEVFREVLEKLESRGIAYITEEWCV